MDIQTANIEKINKVARDVIILSRNTLLVNLRFLDMALSRLELCPIDSYTLMTDGENILYNPHYVLECYCSEREIPVRDYLHIVFHCVFRHMYIAPTLNRQYWDLACDIAVENVITELNLSAVNSSRAQLQKEYIDSIKLKLKHVTAEKIYAYLQQTKPGPKKIASIRECFCADDHEIWYMTQEQAEKAFGTSDSENGDSSSDNSHHGDSSSKNSSSSSENGGSSSANGDSSSANGDSTSANGDSSSANGGCSDKRGINRNIGVSHEMSEVWQEISERMQVDLETFGKQQGVNSGAMTQNLAEVNREKYDYTSFLKKFAVMGEAMRLNDDEFDYIFYTYGLKLYKKMPLIEPLEYREIKAIKEFVIAIDTSGSTSAELVQKFIQKTYNILESTESFFSKINLHIIQCDAAIQEDKKITCREDFDEYIKTMKIYGLGGTDFRPVFEYVDKLKAEKEFQNLKGLIYFTDGVGTFPTRKPDYNAAFVFVDDEYNNLNVPPWAIKLILQKNEI